MQEQTQVDKDIRRQRAIEQAVERGDRIILDASDGSCEETNYLTAMVAKKWLEKAFQPLTSAILQIDMGFTSAALPGLQVKREIDGTVWLQVRNGMINLNLLPPITRKAFMTWVDTISPEKRR
jgi:hypothetical protein